MHAYIFYNKIVKDLWVGIMRIKLVQNAIDALKQKKYKDDYTGIINTLTWLGENTNNDVSAMLEKVKKHAKFMPNLHYKEDEKEIRDFLNDIDVKSLPDAKGELREHQLKLADFAHGLVYDLEKAMDITCLLTGGALIGAARNGKFIPWDDDIDFDVMRNEFEQLIEYAKKHYIFFDSYNCSSYKEYFFNINKLLKENPNKVIFSQKPSCLSAYKGTSLENSICTDFFPRDYINPEITKEQYYKYRDSFENVLLMKKFKPFFDTYKAEMSNEQVYRKESNLTAYGWGNVSFITKNLSVLNIEDIKPLKKIKFEGKDFYTINNISKYLQNFYGDYMKMPLKIKLTGYKQVCLKMHKVK